MSLGIGVGVLGVLCLDDGDGVRQGRGGWRETEYQRVDGRKRR